MSQPHTLLFTDLLSALQAAKEALDKSEPKNASIEAEARHERARQKIISLLPQIQDMVPPAPIPVATPVTNAPSANMVDRRQRSITNILNTIRSGNHLPKDPK